jgi:hypothetical protein
MYLFDFQSVVFMNESNKFVQKGLSLTVPVLHFIYIYTYIYIHIYMTHKYILTYQKKNIFQYTVK